MQLVHVCYKNHNATMPPRRSATYDLWYKLPHDEAMVLVLVSFYSGYLTLFVLSVCCLAARSRGVSAKASGRYSRASGR